MTSTDRASTHQLAGLEADSLLAFLALLGLLRALDAARPDWEARVAWSGTPPVVQLELSTPVSRVDVTNAVQAAFASLVDAFDFGGKKKVDFSRAEFADQVVAAKARSACQAAYRLSLLSALGALVAPRDRKLELTFRSTALVVADGDSQNFFLKRLQLLVKGAEDAEVFADRIGNALFTPWERGEAAKDGALRWDSAEERPYAHRARAPNDDEADPPSTELGADALAILGMTAVSVVPSNRGAATIAMTGRRTGATFTWPLWSPWLTLGAIRALLRHPELSSPNPSPSALSPYGVSALVQSTVVSVARLNVFARGRLLSS